MITFKVPQPESEAPSVRSGGGALGELRLDRYIADALDLSRAETARLIARDGVRIDGRAARKGEELLGGETITIDRAALDAMRVVEPDAGMRLAILYEDAHLIAVDKAPGVACIPLRPGERGTIANGLVARAPEQALIGLPREARLVHRLDTGTSGVLLAARTEDAYAALRERWSSGGVAKTYLAIVEGVISDGGVIDAPIAHHATSARRMVLAASALARHPQPARTEFEPVGCARGHSLLRVRILEGRRHQIRVHLASIGHPVAGDPLYGPAQRGARERGRSSDHEERHGSERLALHSHRLAFAHPASGESIEIESPLPPDLAALVGPAAGSDQNAH